MAFGNIGIRTREGEGFYCALARFISSYYLRVIVVQLSRDFLMNQVIYEICEIIIVIIIIEDI